VEVGIQHGLDIVKSDDKGTFIEHGDEGKGRVDQIGFEAFEEGFHSPEGFPRDGRSGVGMKLEIGPKVKAA
jgi:hypothetical protein